MKNKIFIKSPIRYPGGKSKALDVLIPHVPTHIKYNEPFVGGGSLFLRLSQLNPNVDYWINDLFYPVYCFWKVLREQPMTMMNYILQKKDEFIIDRHEIVKKGIASSNAVNGKTLHSWCRGKIKQTINEKDEFHTACLWYILNKTSFSGMAMIGSYAKLAWDQNFTDSCIFNLPNVAEIMHGVKSLKITNDDYSILLENNKDTFIYLDPPYDIKDNLYGNNGDMHRGFNHLDFYNKIKECQSKWMITYNANPVLIDRFKPYNCKEWDLQYTMKAAKRAGQAGSESTGKSGKKGKELLVWNYNL